MPPAVCVCGVGGWMGYGVVVDVVKLGVRLVPIVEVISTLHTEVSNPLDNEFASLATDCLQILLPHLSLFSAMRSPNKLL